MSISLFAKFHPCSFAYDDSIESFHEYFDNSSYLLLSMINLYFDLFYFCYIFIFKLTHLRNYNSVTTNIIPVLFV